MIALRITFLAGRFHATPWDRSVNEGEVEWPPAPWRLLRALVAAWHAIGEPEAARFLGILDALAEPPTFLLPPATTSHTRHYMPQGTIAKSGRPDTTLVLDAFVAIEKTTAAYVIWDRVTLDEAERELLNNVVASVTYLGRAESWCRVELESHESENDLRATVVERDRYVHVDLASRLDGSGPTVRRLAAMPGVRGAGLRAAIDEPTGVMRKAKRVIPAAATWIDYRFPAHFGFAPEPSAAFVRPVTMPRRVERFVLEASSKSLLPNVTETIVVAEAFRNAAMKRFSELNGSASSPMLSGKAPDGTKGLGHQHAYYLPRDIDNDGKIDHVDVYFPAGSTHDEHRAVSAVDILYDWRFDLGAEQRFVTTYLGNAEMLPTLRWTTETPCILDRQPKRRDLIEADTFVSGQVREMLARHGIASSVKSVIAWSPRETLQHRGGNRTLLQSFRTARSNGPRLPPFGLTIEFEEVQAGPIVFGRLAHFGLGQLRPVT